jgi:hypothetical protein
MGADLYIHGKMFDPEGKEDRLREEWDELIRARNEITDKSAGEWAKLQKRIEEVGDALWENNPEYFRDSYNASNCLWPIGLSYWRDVGDMLDEIAEAEAKKRGYETIEELYDDEENEYHSILTPKYCLKLVGMIKEAQGKHPEPTDEFLETNCHVDEEDPEHTREAWCIYYEEKREKLIAFLERGATCEGVRCSI